MAEQDKIILISAPKIIAIETIECGEELVDISQVTGVKLDKKGDWHSDQYHLVRKTIAKKLEEAAKLLPQNMIFLFKEGHRSLAIQQKLFDWYCGVLKERHPTFPQDKIEVLATEWVARPILNAPHSTGGAFDLTLAYKDGTEVNMGSVIDDTSEHGKEYNKTYSNIISAEGKQNRHLLIDVLSSQDFQNYPFEWWHWSYGDRYWAYHRNTNAIYASVD
jgi:D-alanyl-D-alanine dipeptidase